MSETQRPTMGRPGDYLAHGDGFVLLHQLLHCDDDTARCTVTIAPGIPFFEADTGVPGWVGIEYMAQTIGVHAGWQRARRGMPIVPGLLVGSRRYQCEVDHFRPSQTLEIGVELLVHDASGVGAYRCTVRCDGTVIARSDIKAFQPHDVQNFLDSIYTPSA